MDSGPCVVGSLLILMRLAHWNTNYIYTGVNMKYIAKVKRPFPAKDEEGNIIVDENGVAKQNPGWTTLGYASNGGAGITVRPNFQPLVVNGKVEPIFIFPEEDKKEEVANG